MGCASGAILEAVSLTMPFVAGAQTICIKWWGLPVDLLGEDGMIVLLTVPLGDFLRVCHHGSQVSRIFVPTFFFMFLWNFFFSFFVFIFVLFWFLLKDEIGWLVGYEAVLLNFGTFVLK